MIKKLKEILGKIKIDLILLGDTHGFLDDNAIQEKIIKIFKPTIFLYEMLEETSLLTTPDRIEFLKKSDEEDFSVISKFGELKKTIVLANKYNLPIAGNDLKNMCRCNKDFLTKTELTNEEVMDEERILSKREERQKEEIEKYLEKGDKVLATTGAFHLRRDSPLLKMKKPYLLIYPLYAGEQLFEPPENFDINKVAFEIREIN